MLSDSFWVPVLLSLRIALIAGTISFLSGVAVAWGMAKRRFRGRSALETIFLLPLVLPPTVVGFGLLVILGKHSPLKPAIDFIWGSGLLFTPAAAVIAAAVVSFPLAFMTVRTGFEEVPDELLDAARSMGATSPQLLRYVLLPGASRSLYTAFILSFARSLGEFGATMMVAGNIPGWTQTVPSAIYIAVETGQYTLAWLWSGAMAAIAFALLFAVGGRR